MRNILAPVFSALTITLLLAPVSAPTLAGDAGTMAQRPKTPAPIFKRECMLSVSQIPLARRSELASSVNLKFVNMAATQLSGGNDLKGGEFPEYLDAFVSWLKALVDFEDTEQQITEFKEGHIKRLELLHRIAGDDKQVFPTGPIQVDAVGSINKRTVTSPKKMWKPKPIQFKSRKALDEAIEGLQQGLETVVNERETELNLQQGIFRWKIRKVLEAVEAGYLQEAHERLKARRDEAKAAGKTLSAKDFLEGETPLTNGALLEAAIFMMEDHTFEPLPWADPLIDAIMNSYVTTIADAKKGIVYSARQGIGRVVSVSTGIKKVWGTIRLPIEAVGILTIAYVSVTNGWTESTQKLGKWWHGMTTPAVVLAWEESVANYANIKLVVADPVDDFDKFGPNIGYFYQEKTSDHAGRVAREYINYWKTTGKTDWKPADPKDASRLAGAAQQIQTYNIMMFGKDNRGNKIVTGAIERIPMREANIQNWVDVTKLVEEGKIKDIIPLPDGVTPPGPELPTIKDWSKTNVLWNNVKGFTIRNADGVWTWTKDQATGVWSWTRSQFVDEEPAPANQPTTK